jgi:hypothetical protein
MTMKDQSVFALVGVVIALAMPQPALADTFDRKGIRMRAIPFEQGKITCVKQAAGWIGQNQTGPPSAVEVQSWTDPSKDGSIGKETVSMEIDRRRHSNGRHEVLAIGYTSETGRTTTYRPGPAMRLVLDDASGQLFISAFTGDTDVWTFHLTFSTGLGIKTETMFGTATSVRAYGCQ